LTHLRRSIHSDALPACYDPGVSPRERVAALAVAAALVNGGGCASPGGPGRPSLGATVPSAAGVAAPTLPAPDVGLRERGLSAPEDPTVRGGRILPVSLEGSRAWGSEPGGGVRTVVTGVRLVAWPDGAMTSAVDRLPATPSLVVELPERLGGGFLLAIGARLWRAATWLGPAVPVFTSPLPIVDVSLGLDRVYARSPQGILEALDPRTGFPLGLGPVPASPRVVRVAALDAWREIALADLRGVLVTSDAGVSWRSVALPFQPTDVSAGGGAFSVEGLDANRKTTLWQVAMDGDSSWLSAAPIAAMEPPPEPVDPVVRTFGTRALGAALEDGWPLVDGTALVARGGALARVRLADGALVEAIGGAFPLASARCHPLSLAGKVDRSAFGFVCGEPHGPTVLYAWDAPRSRLVELRRFDDAREVLGFGNGALAVRGGCSASSARTEPEGPVREQSWCVRPAGGPTAEWSEVGFGGEGVASARLVVLADGRTALVRPPTDGDLSTARLTLGRSGVATHLVLKIPALRADVAHALRWGTWMDGFEERRPGVLGGWIDTAGSILGVEITVEGELRAGEYIRDMGSPVAAGRWALGWTGSGAGFETTDGGMTWTKEIELPVPITGERADRERVCGPIGCIVAGWLRVGWKAAPLAPPPEAPPAHPLATRRPAAALMLDCDVLAGKPPEAAPAPRRALPAEANSRVTPALRLGSASSTLWGTASEVGPFAGRAAPALGPDERGALAEVSSGLDRVLRSQPFARLYAWGPASGDWSSPPGRWQVRWQSPFDGWPEARSSGVSQGSWSSVEAARRAIGANQPSMWAFAPGDDADHALLVSSDSAGAGGQVIVLEADRAPVEARPAGGDAFPLIEAAVRSGGRWYVASTQRPGEPEATLLWAIDGASGHELGRVPRLVFPVRPAVRLARRGDGRAIGIMLEGEPELNRGTSLWVAPFDVDSGTLGEPERMANFDLVDRTEPLCTGDDTGWEVDVPYPAEVEVAVGGWSATLQGVMARARVMPNRACIDRLFGSSGAYASSPPGAFAPRLVAAPAGGGAGHPRTFDVSVLSARTRFPLRCHPR